MQKRLTIESAFEYFLMCTLQQTIKRKNNEVVYFFKRRFEIMIKQTPCCFAIMDKRGASGMCFLLTSFGYGIGNLRY